MASRSLILHRLTSHFAVGIKQNQRLLLSSRFHSCTGFPDTVHMTADCVQRMKQLKAQDKVLRLRIELGGRLGFRYVFDVVDDKTNPDDRVIKRQGVKLLVDNVSFNVVNGATVDYVDYTTPPAFEVSHNPITEIECGPGTLSSCTLRSNPKPLKGRNTENGGAVRGNRATGVRGPYAPDSDAS